MSKLREILAHGGFAVVAEIQPPRGIDFQEMLAPVVALKDRVTAYGVPDNKEARLGLSPLAAAHLVKKARGEPLMHLTCRDRNRLALESDLMGAAVLGVENLLLVSGDYPTLGDHPQARPVYDADSVQLLGIARGLTEGRDSAGQPLFGSPQFFLGGVVIPEADPLGPQLLKCEKKLRAGAEFLVTAPVFDLEKLQRFQEHLTPLPIKLLVTIKVLEAQEVAQAAEGRWRRVYSLPANLVEELAGLEPEAFTQAAVALAGRLAARIKQEKLADGVYLQAQGQVELLTAILERAGL